MSAVSKEDYRKTIHAIVLHQDLAKCRQVRDEITIEGCDAEESIQVQIVRDISLLFLGASIDWTKSATSFFTHHNIFSDNPSGINIPTPKKLISWMEDRASEGVAASHDDELAAQLLLLFIASRLPSWLPLIEPSLAKFFSSALEVCLRRECIESWRIMAFYIAANRNVYEHTCLADLWEQMIISADNAVQAEYYRIHEKVDLARFYPKETVVDYERVILDCKELVLRIDSLQDTLTADETSIDDYSFELLSIHCKMEIAANLRSLDKHEEAAKIFNSIIDQGQMATESPNKLDQLFRSALLSTTSEAMNIAIVELGDVDEYFRLRTVYRNLSLGGISSWELAGEAVNRGTEAFIKMSFDDAEREFTNAFYRYWNLHSLTKMDHLNGFRGRIYLARCSSSNEPRKVTGLAFQAALAGAMACDKQLVIMARKTAELQGTVPTNEESKPLRDYVLQNDLLTRREKIGACFLASEFIDFFDKRDLDFLIKQASKWSRDAFDLTATRDVARNGIRVLSAVCRVLPGLDDPAESATKIANALKDAVLTHPKIGHGHILLEVADVADVMAEIPREITKTAARVLLEILKEYHWKPNRIGDRAWTSIVRPAIIHSVLNDEEELVTSIVEKFPPISGRIDETKLPVTDELGQSDFFEHSIQYRMYLGIFVDEKQLSEYVEQKTDSCQQEYLSESPRQSFPGQFHSYISCIKQLNETKQRSVLAILLKILIKKEVMPVVRSEALSALRWFVSEDKQKTLERFSFLSNIEPTLIASLRDELHVGTEKEMLEDPFSSVAYQSFPLDVASFLLAGCEYGAPEFQNFELQGQKLSKIVIEWLIEGNSKKRKIAANYQAYQFGKTKEESKQFEELGMKLILTIVKEKNKSIRQQLYAGLAAGISCRDEVFPKNIISDIIIDSCIADSNSSYREMAQRATNVLVAIQGVAQNGDDKLANVINDRINEMKQSNLWLRSMIRTAEMRFSEGRNEAV